MQSCSLKHALVVVSGRVVEDELRLIRVCKGCGGRRRRQKGVKSDHRHRLHLNLPYPSYPHYGTGSPAPSVSVYSSAPSMPPIQTSMSPPPMPQPTSPRGPRDPASSMPTTIVESPVHEEAPHYSDSPPMYDAATAQPPGQWGAKH